MGWRGKQKDTPNESSEQPLWLLKTCNIYSPALDARESYVCLKITWLIIRQLLITVEIGNLYRYFSFQAVKGVTFEQCQHSVHVFLSAQIKQNATFAMSSHCNPISHVFEQPQNSGWDKWRFWFCLFVFPRVVWVDFLGAFVPAQ